MPFKASNGTGLDLGHLHFFLFVLRCSSALYCAFRYLANVRTLGPGRRTSGPFLLMPRLRRAALSRRCGVCSSRLFRLIFLHESISLLRHACARRFVRCVGIKIGMAKGYVGLALL